ncbi:MAG TPA: 16S rRNA (adenine(1518)-N(6)/adenine(1519)-N(6))-dimethyltransferase RsmA [Acidimicrobiia bacterium]
MPLLTPTTVRALLAEHDLHPRRALGQHFLADPNTARRIVRLAGIDEGDHVLEIGPGLGSLTLALADAGASVVALELDPRLAAVLRATLAEAGVDGGADRVRVEVGDALEADLAGLVDSASDQRAREEWHSVSNLPYNVATPVVVRLLEEVPRVAFLMVMVQREVGERLAAGPGSAAYGAVSVKVAYFAEAEVAGTVPPTVFVPQPKVESVLVRMTRRPAPPVEVPSPARLFALVRAGFAQRRKMLRRSLRPELGEHVTDVLTVAGIDPATRAEALSLPDWAAVARAEEAVAA